MRNTVVHALRIVAALVAAVVTNTRAEAQCQDWIAGASLAGVNGNVFATTIWDPDGSGPDPEFLVIGGTFTLAGDTPANNIVAWDGSKWLPLGVGTNDAVLSLAVYNGELIAGGSFTSAGGSLVNGIARWNGTMWRSLGSGMGGTTASVYCMALHNGQLHAAGQFTTAGGISANSIARWNGSAWQPLGAGINFQVYSLAIYGVDLIAAGNFNGAGGIAVSNIARWNGSSWSPLGSGTNSTIFATAVYGGELVVGGGFTIAGGVACSRLARWNGVLWQPFATGGANDVVFTMTIDQAYGNLIIGGKFTAVGGVTTSYMAWYLGGTWHAFIPGQPLQGGDPLVGQVKSVLWNTRHGIVIGGTFTSAGIPASRVVQAQYNSGWHSLVPGGGDREVFTLATYGGKLVAAGSFSRIGGINANIAAWDGGLWQPVGSGSVQRPGGMGLVYAMIVHDNALVIGGIFDMVGGVSCSNVARWNGVSWQAMGVNNPSGATDFAVHNGQVYCIFQGSVFRWIGSSWQSATSSSGAWSLASYGGYLIVGRDGGISRLNGSVLEPFPVPLESGYVTTLATLGTSLIVSGYSLRPAGFSTSHHILRWDGASWHEMGSGLDAQADALAAHNGLLYAAGLFSGRVARWSGTGWASMGGLNSLANPAGGNARPCAVASWNSEVIVGGIGFCTGGSQPVGRSLARWTPTGVPWISREPAPQVLTVGGSASFTVAAAEGYSGLTYQWRRNGSPVSNGPGGASLGGGTVSGATAPVLAIAGAQASDAGAYSCLVTRSPCGSVASDSAPLSYCYPNCDGSTVVPILNVTDFVCFLNRYASLHPYANCDNSTTPPTLNVADFICFLNRYAAGCP